MVPDVLEVLENVTLASGMGHGESRTFGRCHGMVEEGNWRRPVLAI
jgi:hypothetical protein